MYFSLAVCQAGTRSSPWQAGHNVNEAEALAAVVALQTLGRRVEGLDLFFFIDNKAADGVLLKGYSRSCFLKILAALFWQTVRSLEFATWAGRVLSCLNVADGPSREDFTVVTRLGATRLSTQLPKEDTWGYFWDYLQQPVSDNHQIGRARDKRSKRQRLHQGQG